MRIWVTGAAGFVGRRLVDALRSEHDVIALARDDVDLAAPDALGRLARLPRPDVVVHTASRQPGHPLSRYLEDNVLATGRLVEALGTVGTEHVVYTSTLTVYGAHAGAVSERERPHPDSPYAQSKLWAEQLLRHQPAPVTVLRLPSLYGAGQADSFVDGLARLALAGERIELFDRGERIRDALFVEDAVRVVVRCATSAPSDDFALFNLGIGRAVTAREYAVTLVAELGSSSEIVPVDRSSPQRFDLHADISEARRRLAFEPPDLVSAIRSYVHELRAQL
jgi:nucleoside-diphosphate-sugar epimerase